MYKGGGWAHGSWQAYRDASVLGVPVQARQLPRLFRCLGASDLSRSINCSLASHLFFGGMGRRPPPTRTSGTQISERRGAAVPTWCSGHWGAPPQCLDIQVEEKKSCFRCVVVVLERLPASILFFRARQVGMGSSSTHLRHPPYCVVTGLIATCMWLGGLKKGTRRETLEDEILREVFRCPVIRGFAFPWGFAPLHG